MLFSRFLTLSTGITKLVLSSGRFFLRAYKNHWYATPAAAFAAVVSTLGAATIILLFDPLLILYVAREKLIICHAIIAPLLAYLLYLGIYYSGMFFRERKALLNSEGNLDSDKLRLWLRVVRYDYLAHVPSDIYLISLAAVMQAALEKQGVGVFWAVITSQFVDDFITFLKEPAIWNGARELVAWEKREETTLLNLVRARYRKKA